MSELAGAPALDCSCEPPSLTPVLPVPEFPLIVPSPSDPDPGGGRVRIEVVVFGAVVTVGLVVVGATVFATGVEVVGETVVVGATGAIVVDGAPTWGVPRCMAPEFE